MTHPFLSAIYLAARKEIRKAREAEDIALECALEQYRGGHLGRRARRLYDTFSKKRGLHLELALSHRGKASRLRRELRRLEEESTLPGSAA